MWKSISLAMLLPSTLAGIAEAAQPEMLQYQLDNGLRVTLRPMETAQQVALAVLYSVGGDHDPMGCSGLAHLLEHLYVTAEAGKTQARTFREYVQRYPQGWNAQTGDRYTVVATVFSPEALNRELEDAAARMGDLRVTADDLEREKRRVLEELGNMYESVPSLAARNLARQMVRPSTKDGRKGGVPEQVSRVTLDTVQAWWRRYYKPVNATLVLAGGFEVPSARAAVAKHFAALAPGELAPSVSAGGDSEAGKAKQVTVTPRRPNAQSQVCLAYAAPSASDDCYAAFLVLVARLQAGAMKLQSGSGHFPISYAPLDDPSAVYVTAPLGEKETGEEAIARLETLVSEAIEGPIRPGDLTLTRSFFAFLLGTQPLPDAMLTQNVYGVAFGIGRRAQLGIQSARLAKAIEAVGDEDLDRARALFEPGARAAVVVSVRPES